MKTYFYFILLFFALTSCTENDDPTLSLTRTEWYLDRLGTDGGEVHLIIEGTTTADKVTILTYGDGVPSDREIELDSKNHFYDDVIISFSVIAVPTEEFTVSTDLKIYKNTDMITVTLTSGKLKY